ncbi:MAG: amidohydrolase, partial [Bacillota bacterium]
MAVMYVNGRVHTMDARGTVVEAVAEEHGTVIAAGTTADVRRGASPRTREVDLQGMTVVPGLTDSHTHFMMFSLGLSRVTLEGVVTLEEALRRVGEAAKLVPEGAWVLGGGFNKNVWAGAVFPTRYDLDSVCRDHPVALLSFDCHTMWVNSLALKICGITRNTRAPEGGRIDSDPSGEPTGIIGENAMPMIERHIPKPSSEQMRRSLLAGMKAANGLGLVGAHVMEGADSLGAFRLLEMEDRLTLRTCVFIPADNLEDAVRLGIRSGFGGRRLWIGGVKLFTDGSLNSQTADMLEPYEGTAERGIASISREELDRIVGRAVSSGMSTAIHAIGDAANRKVLDVLAGYRGQSNRAGLRHRIEHAQMIHPADLARFAQMVAVASVQPVHATSDR